MAAIEVLALNRQPAQRAWHWRRQYGPSHGTGLADALIAASAVGLRRGGFLRGQATISADLKADFQQDMEEMFYGE